MAIIVLDPLLAESGTICYDGIDYTGLIPQDTADSGWALLRGVEYRGWISFDTTILPPGTTINDASISVASVTTSGTADRWQFYFELADLDLDDLPGSWADTRGGLSFDDEDPPTSYSTSLSGLVDLLFNADHSRIAFKIRDVVEAGDQMIYPLISSATLTLDYVATAGTVTMDSGLALEVAMDCGLGSASTGESGLGTELESDSGAALETDLVSGLGSTVELDSDADLEE